MTLETDSSRSALTRLYYEEVERLDLDALEMLCRYLGVDIHDVLEFTYDKALPSRRKGKKS